MTDDSAFYGTAPSTLRVEDRSDGGVRLRITVMGQPDAVVDLDPDRLRHLADDLASRHAR